MGNDTAATRPLPQDTETERALLGAILIYNELIIQVSALLSPDDFFVDLHGKVFQHMVMLSMKGAPIDEITLKDSLDAAGSRDTVSLAFLSGLADGAPRLQNVRHYADIIKRKSLLRKLIWAAQEISEMGYSQDEDVPTILRAAETRIFDIAQSYVKKNYIPLVTALYEAYSHLASLYETKTALTGITTGFQRLDLLTCGLQRGELTIIAARPSMGKTTLAVNMAMNAALLENRSVAIFSLEMTAKQLALRILSSEARIDHQKVRSGFFSKQDWDYLGRALGRLEGGSKVFIDETAGLSVVELQSKARRLKREEGLDLIVIDYLQLMTADTGRKNDNRVQEISEISRSLKALAKDIDVPVIALSQLSRSTESRKGDHRPMLSDLRDSGSIEQDADVVMFIFREEYYKRDDPSLTNKAEVIIAKQRNGPVDTVQLCYLKEFSRFENMAYETEHSTEN